MTVTRAIEEVDNLKPNDYPGPDKVRWLSRLDEQIKLEIYDTHALNEGETAPTLWSNNNINSELLVKAPYDEMYLHYLAAQIDYYNREYDGFEATNTMFTACYNSFRNHYNATHRPLTAKKTYF